MIFAILTIIFLIYLLSVPKIMKVKLGASFALSFRIIILVTTSILIALLIAETYNIYPKQYWVTKIVFCIALFSCMLAYGLCNKKYFSTLEQLVYGIIFYSPVLFIVFLFGPFFGIAYGLVFYVKFIGDSKFILYSDDAIRIEQPYIRFLGPDPSPIVYVKNKITSFQDTTIPFSYHAETDKIEVTKQNERSYTIILKSPNHKQILEGIDTFYYYIHHKSKDK